VRKTRAPLARERVEISELARKAWEQLSKRRDASAALPTFFVEDNGSGFDEKRREQLFLPFQGLDPSPGQRGAGVRLATCARIVQRHGGRIWAEYHPGRGTRFSLTLSR